MRTLNQLRRIFRRSRPVRIAARGEMHPQVGIRIIHLAAMGELQGDALTQAIQEAPLAGKPL